MDGGTGGTSRESGAPDQGEFGHTSGSARRGVATRAAARSVLGRNDRESVSESADRVRAPDGCCVADRCREGFGCDDDSRGESCCVEGREGDLAGGMARKAVSKISQKYVLF